MNRAAPSVAEVPQGLLASKLSSHLNDLLQSMVDGSSTVYDKAMDARYIETGIGGGNHRLFDGGHHHPGSLQCRPRRIAG